MKYPEERFPKTGLRMMPQSLQGLAKFYSNLNAAAVVTKCPNTHCCNFMKPLTFGKNINYYDGYGFHCEECNSSFKIRPPIFQNLHASFFDLSDALVYFLNRSSSSTILENCTSLTPTTLSSLKLRLDATILLGDDTVAPTIQLGGNLGRNRVESDDLVNGRRRKGKHGHATQILCHIWGARGIDPADGRKKWLLEPFYLGVNKEVATEDVEKFLEKHIANMTWFISDGGVAYQGWVNETEKLLKHCVANHSLNTFVRKNVQYEDFSGAKSIVKIHTNDIEGYWKSFRLEVQKEADVNQARMRGFCHRQTFFYNHKGENLLHCLGDYLHLKVGSAIRCREILHWDFGYKYRNKAKARRKKKKKASTAKFVCGCGRTIRDTPSSRSQHRIYYCPLTRYKSKTKRSKTPRKIKKKSKTKKVSKRPSRKIA